MTGWLSRNQIADILLEVLKRGFKRLLPARVLLSHRGESLTLLGNLGRLARVVTHPKVAVLKLLERDFGPIGQDDLVRAGIIASDVLALVRVGLVGGCGSLIVVCERGNGVIEGVICMILGKAFTIGIVGNGRLVGFLREVGHVLTSWWSFARRLCAGISRRGCLALSIEAQVRP